MVFVCCQLSEREREKKGVKKRERGDRVHLDLLQKKKCTEKIISAKAQRKRS